MLDRDQTRIHKEVGITGTTTGIIQKAGDNLRKRNLIHFCTVLMMKKIYFMKNHFIINITWGKWKSGKSRKIG
ncbi:hypothetical protein TH63_17725 [Rufibacter radiotolerans]|uniref:Uncharacterized protein n=1 Tax=Rufibacter radiotolerans TaxID=1379910 RepID=A0A0H4W9E9_9BACT|nr:hypothetical protein TH63_17725 [Rufibacter radiotolerans]